MIGNIYLRLKVLKTSSLLKIFYYNNKVTWKVKAFQKLSNKEIFLSLQSNSAKYNKSFKFIPWPNFLEGRQILSHDIWGKTFSHLSEMLWWIASYIFSIWYKLIYFYVCLNPAIHRMGNASNIICPRCKEQKEFQPYFIFHHSSFSSFFIVFSKLVNFIVGFFWRFLMIQHRKENLNVFIFPLLRTMCCKTIA